MATKTESPTNIKLTKENFTNTHVIHREEITKSRRTISVRINPTGEQTEEYNFRLNYTKDWVKMILSTRLSKQEALNTYRIVYIPSISYSLGAIYFTPEKCKYLQTQAFKTYLPKIGFNRKFPQQIIYGPPKYGGWGEKQIYSIMAINQIKLFMGRIRNNDDTGKLLLSELEYVQLISEMQHPILNKSTKNIFLKWTPSCWITNFKQILNHIDGKTRIENQWQPSLQRKKMSFSWKPTLNLPKTHTL